MPKASWIQNSFNAGELSPQLRGRVDLDKYRNGCNILENFIPQVHGPAKKRTGTRFVKEVKNSTKRVRLIPFQYNTEQAYILEFGDKYIRFFKDGGIVLTSLNIIYEITSPYDSEDIDTIHFAQSADVMYLAHPKYPPQKLSRFDHDSWTIEQVNFRQPPFNDENITATTVTSSDVTGSVTLTSSVALFKSTDVGSYISFTEIIESKYDRWDANKSIVIGDYRHYLGNLYVATSAGTTGTRPPIHLEGVESDGVVSWEYAHSGSGYAQIAVFTSTTVVTATVIKRLPQDALAGSTRYAFSAWSDVSGYPKAVTFYEDRLWFAGSLAKPQTLWASVSGAYENHEYGTNDDDALNYTINSQEVNVIEWLSPSKILSVGTSGGEFVVSGSSLNDAITPTNVRIVPQTTYGSKDIQPFKIGGSVLFVQRAGKKIRELTYQFESDSYVAPNMTLLAEHITQKGIADMSYQQEPDQILWCPDMEGNLLGMTYERLEDVVGWHRHNVGGVVESVAAIPHWDRDQDVLWMVVKRTIDGNDVRYIEYMEKYFTDDRSFYMDSGLTYSGVPVTTITGLDHLEGEEVVILTDGAIHPSRVVNSGEINLLLPSSKVTVGLPYTATYQSMSIEAGAADGTSQGKTVRINNIVIRLSTTGPGLFYGPSVSQMDEYHPRNTTMNMDEPIPVFTGDTDLLPWPGEYQTEPRVTIQHRLPTPCILVAVMPQLTTYDR